MSLMPKTCLKRVGQATKHWKSKWFLIKKNSWVNWQQVTNMTECKRSILELQVNMVRGSSIYKKKVFKLWNNFRIDIVSEKL